MAVKERMIEMPTDIQFKYELRRELTEIRKQLQLLQNKEYSRLEQRYLQKIKDIESSLQD